MGSVRAAEQARTNTEDIFSEPNKLLARKIVSGECAEGLITPELGFISSVCDTVSRREQQVAAANHDAVVEHPLRFGRQRHPMRCRGFGARGIKRPEVTINLLRRRKPHLARARDRQYQKPQRQR